MKIIKSIATLIVSVFATGLLHAQELKVEIAKPMEEKIPAAVGNKPSPQARFKPQLQAATSPSEAPAAAEAPSPLNRKEDADKSSEKAKLLVKTVVDDQVAITPGGAAGQKILAGKSEKPKQAAEAPNTIDPNAKPVPAKPAIAKAQQQ